MEKLFEKVQGYLRMEDEIAFDEFKNYYEQVMDFLKDNYENLEREDYLKARFILVIIGINAEGRAQRKDKEAKKYKKMKEKAVFWSDATSLRLKEMGMTQEEIETSYNDMMEAI